MILHLQDTHAHRYEYTELFTLLHLNPPEDHPREESENQVHASGVR